jgi:hypothetical protein
VRSDLTGERLAGDDAATPITITFPDGSRRRLTGSAGEVAALKQQGEPLSRGRGSALRARLPSVGKLIAAAIALYVGGVVVPALVQQ